VVGVISLVIACVSGCFRLGRSGGTTLEMAGNIIRAKMRIILPAKFTLSYQLTDRPNIKLW
jgi:hypothetical protein